MVKFSLHRLLPRLTWLALVFVSNLFVSLCQADELSGVFSSDEAPGTPLLRIVATETKAGDVTTLRSRGYLPDGTFVSEEESVLKNGRDVSYYLKVPSLKLYGTMRIDDGKVEYEFTKDTKTVKESETASGVLLTGPGIRYYIREHLQELIEGKTLSVRTPSLDRQETFGMELSKQDQDDDEKAKAAIQPKDVIRIRMRPTSLIIRAFAKSMYFLVDAKDGELRGYVGPLTLSKTGKDAPSKTVHGSILYQKTTPSVSGTQSKPSRN